MNEEVFKAVTAALGRGEPAALVTIVAAHGSTPQRVGAKMLVFADGRTVGTIGGGCYENDAFWKAREAIRAGSQPQVVRYELDDDLAAESGLICGGQMEVYIEPLSPSPHLYVAGAGHVAASLASIAHEAGFRVHVIDDREKFANPERFPAADLIVQAIPDWLQAATLPPSAYVVVVTRGHRHDLDALRALAGRELKYVGMIGSRAKVKRIEDALLAEGVSADFLRSVHAPIGLDIGAVTPAEIAVSIVAELIAVRYGRAAGREAASLQWNRLPTP